MYFREETNEYTRINKYILISYELNQGKVLQNNKFWCIDAGPLPKHGPEGKGMIGSCTMMYVEDRRDPVPLDLS